MASIADLSSAIGVTPPGTPNTQAQFRATKESFLGLLRAQLQVAFPQPPIPQPTIQAPTNVVPLTAPRVGGIEIVAGYPMAWTGGSLNLLGTNTLTKPFTSAAYRSTDLSQALKIEKTCTSGLPESRRLPVPGPINVKDASSAVTIVSWQRELAQALKERGLDAVFRAMIDGTEVFLLEKWGKATKENIKNHVAFLRSDGDEYDSQNLKLSAKFLKNSLDDEMLRRVEQELGDTLTTEATGPDIYGAVIALHTVINDSTERLYISQLQKLKLTKEPGEDVSLFSDKVVGIARHIGGLSNTPVSDLHTLIYQCYEGSTTPTFATAVSTLLSDCFKGVGETKNWEANVMMLKSMYRDLVNRSSWVALKNMKEKVEGL
jgi:hypothetical protein